MTQLLLRQTGVSTYVVISTRESKGIRVIGEFHSVASMNWYGYQFHLLTIGFYIPTENLLAFMAKWFGGDKENDNPLIILIMVLDLKALYQVQERR